MIRSLERISLLVAAIVLLAVAPLEAQRGSQSRRTPQDREQLEQRIRARMGEMMRQRLGLSEDEAARLSEVVQGFDMRRRELFAEERTTRRRVEALRREGSDDQQAAAELLDAMTQLRLREAELFAEEQSVLLEVLTPVQVLELHALREQIGRRIRELRGGRGGAQSGRRRGGLQGDTSDGSWMPSAPSRWDAPWPEPTR